MNPFEKMRARWLLVWLIAGLFFSFAPGEIVRSPAWLKAHPDDSLATSLGSLLTSACIFIPPAIYAWWAGLRISQLYGPWPARREAVQLALVGVPTLGLSLTVVYLVFAPLSLVFPEAMQEFLFKNESPIDSAGAPYPFLANAVGFLATVIAAPVAEEWFVRGLLLNRWSYKVGVIRAVMRTSLVFALLHPDPIGALIFGFIMCGLYAHFGTLWAPTLAHATNNAIAWGFSVLFVHGPTASEVASVAAFRSAWWIPVIGVLLVLPWAIRLRGRYKPISTWRFAAPDDAPARTAAA